MIKGLCLAVVIDERLSFTISSGSILCTDCAEEGRHAHKQRINLRD